MDESLRLPLAWLRFSRIFRSRSSRSRPSRSTPPAGWTPARQVAFILRLVLIGGVAAAARAVGMSRESAYPLRDHPGATSFAAAWDKALGRGRGRAADLATERAIHGEKRGVYYRGRKVGEYVRHDNRLLIAAMNRFPPEAAPDGDLNETLRNLLGEIDPGGAERPLNSNDFSPRFA